MREETLLIGTRKEIIDYYNSLGIKPKDYTATESCKMEMVPIEEQIDTIKEMERPFGMIYWMNYSVEEDNIVITIDSRFVMIYYEE